MAILSSSRRSTGFAGIAALLLAVVSLGLAGCGNDNASDSGGTMKVDIRGLVGQMNGDGGGRFSTMATGVEESAATTAVKSLIIGAVVITFQGTPLDEGTQINSDLEDKLASDVINSINYFSIVDLPTSESFVEFKVPPPGAGNWQVAAIGTRNKIATFEDLNDSSVAIYYGFTPKFYQTSGSTGPDVDITMNRACLIDDPPKGCATFDENGSAVVTSDVKVWGIYLNGGGNLLGGPVTNNAGAMDGALGAVSSGDTVKVTMTHPLDPNFDFASCNAPGDVSVTGPCMGVSTIRY